MAFLIRLIFGPFNPAQNGPFSPALTPVKSGNDAKLFEYMANLIIKCQKEEYVDFVRALTPLIADLFELILKDTKNFIVDQYCFQNSRGVRKWDQIKLSGTEAEDILMSRWEDFHYGDVYSAQLVELIAGLNYGNADLIGTVTALREVEEKIRNIAAHEIVSVTDSIIKAKTGYTSLQVINLLKKTFSYTKMNIKKEYWNTYDDMNEKICEQLKSEW